MPCTIHFFLDGSPFYNIIKKNKELLLPHNIIIYQLALKGCENCKAFINDNYYQNKK